MKKALLLLLALAALAAAQMRITGQAPVRTSLITWATGANTGKTRVLFHLGNVYLDTSATGQAGQWKRIDNTADSCSVPALIVSDSFNIGKPIWEYRLLEAVRAVNASANSHVYRVQTRDQYVDSRQQLRWLDWSKKGINSGYQDITVQDSLLMASTGTTAKVRLYSLAMFLGTQARLCPDDVPSTSRASGDSVFADSLYLFTR